MEYYKESLDHEVMVGKFKDILARKLPNCHTSVLNKVMLGQQYVIIRISCSPYLINSVPDQTPQRVALTYDRKRLSSSSRTVYREINPDDPKEHFYVMKGINVPFKATSINVERALERFCDAYVDTLVANIDRLMYRDVVDYKKVLQTKDYLIKKYISK